jgi:threonine/homoserine/homoserine lactone efflux protein
MHTLALGFGLGFVVALQIGPMSLWLVRSTLRSGLAVGLAIGAGIAVIDAGYAAAGAAGAAPLLTIGPLETVLGLAGASVMAVLGIRTIRSAFEAQEAARQEEVGSVRRAFLVSLAATASNPLTIASWAAVFAAAGAACSHDPVPLVAGVGLGSLAWVSLLATGTAGAGRAVGPRVIRAADLFAGSAMLVFAAALAAGAA